MGRKPHSNPTIWFLPGVTTGPWGGMRRDGSRTDIPDNQFYTLQNIRMVGDDIVVRGGQTKLNTAVLSGTSVVGIHGRGPTPGDVTSSGSSQILYLMEKPV